MATIIKLKRSTTASAVPTTSNLSDGEVAVNITDKKIYQRSGNDIVEISNTTNFESVDSDIFPSSPTTHALVAIPPRFPSIVCAFVTKDQVTLFLFSPTDVCV